MSTRRFASAVAALICLAWLVWPAHAADPGTPFDHFSTGFPLSGQHVRVACESCHVKGVFKGTPTQCGGCHNGGIAPGKNARHIVISSDCDDCHTTLTWTGARMDHSTVSGACKSCHNGASAPGMPASHIRTTADCEECHGTLAWSPARFDHTNVTGTCMSCHNGSTATGKHAGHIQTTADCDDCHNTRAWEPANFNHGNISGRCDACHNGKTATGKHSGHITTTSDCDTCHTTTAWKPATFHHDNITGRCDSCHNGAAATGKNNGHFVTTSDCNVCHTITRWDPAVYAHTAAMYPGNHNSKVSCTDCHTTRTGSATWTATQYKPDCAGCHASDFKSGPHKKYETPTTVTYTVAELKNCTGACHVYTDSTLTTIAKTRNSHHVVSKGGW